MKISKEKLELYFLLLPCFATIYLDVDKDIFNIIAHILAFWQIISFALVFIKFFSLKMNHKKINTIIYFISFVSILLLAMIINKNNLSQMIRFVRLYIPIFTFMMLLYITNRKKIIIDILYHILYFLIILNGILMFFYPNGIFQAYTTRIDITDWKLYQRCNLLGVDNRLIIVFICGIIIAELYDIFIKKQGLKKWVGYGIILMQEIFVWSATGIITITLLLFLIIIINNNKIKHNVNILNFPNILFIYGCLFFILCIFNLLEFFAPFIVNVLGKDITLTNRTYIWELCLDMFWQKPLLGYGGCDIRTYIEFNDYLWYSHNLVLDILLQGGIISLIIFIIFLFKFNRKTRSNIDKICIAGIFAMLIVNIAESFVNSIYFFIPFILFWYIDNYKNNKIPERY